MPCVSFLLTRTADAPLPPRRLSPFGEKTAPRQRPCSQPCGRPSRGFCSSGTPTLYPLSCALPSLANLVATSQNLLVSRAGDCRGLNHTGSLPRGKPRFFRRRNGGSEFAQPETPHPSRAIAERMAGQLSSTCKF